ncbi:hypothetical protein [Microbacterium halophytorum]|uniref:hypothetical protein n=1 Tax=Microbacterium halophytorum TaxID=2067568 RepID=UPI000CFB00E1|nr:hypothetical protein [Microbacterium halophytorum]
MTRRRGLWAAALGIMVLVVGLGSVEGRATDAAFTDPEHAAAGGQLGTVVLQPPVIVSTSCTRPTLLTLTRPFLTVQWRWSESGMPYTGFTGANTRWSIDGRQAQATTVGPDASGVYTTTFTGTLLQALLGSITDLFGSSFAVAGRTVWTPGASEWRSAQAKSIGVNLPLLTGISCPNPDA